MESLRGDTSKSDHIFFGALAITMVRLVKPQARVFRIVSLFKNQWFSVALSSVRFEPNV